MYPDFPEPGKFPQQWSAAPLSARTAGPIRETRAGYVRYHPGDGKGWSEKRVKSCFSMCVINTLEKQTHTLKGRVTHTYSDTHTHTYTEDSGALNEAVGWKCLNEKKGNSQCVYFDRRERE